MAQQATVLILAEVDDDERARLEAACSAAGFVGLVESSAETAISKLTGKRFDAFVVHLGTPGAALACMRARGKLLRVRVPVVALVEGEEDGAFARAYRAGADEVLPVQHTEWLAARLRALPKPSIPQPGNSRGDAVVADADRTRAEVVERVLRDAGFRVEVAVDGFSTRLQAGRPSLKVAVVDASLDDVPALIGQVRSKGARCAWIVRARPEQLDELRAKFGMNDCVAVVSAYGPPDDVLFETNRLLEQKDADGRADARSLYGTILKLRWGANGAEDIGYSYNVSSLGLFVRTLVVPAGDTVGVEVTPPGGDAKVQLDCKVVWRREFGTTRKEPVPAGFGVQIVGGDLEHWAEACPRAPSLRPTMGSEAPPRDSRPSQRATSATNLAAIALPGDVEIRPREPQSSVEEMLASVLNETIPDEEPVGSEPLSIDGDAVVEMNAMESRGEPPRASPVPSLAEALRTEAPPPVEPPEDDVAAPAIDASEITPALLGFDLMDEAVSLPAVSIPIADVASVSGRALSREMPAPAGATTQVVESVSMSGENPGYADTLRPESGEPLPSPVQTYQEFSPEKRTTDAPEELRVPTRKVSPIIWAVAAFVAAGAVAATVLPSRHSDGAAPTSQLVATTLSPPPVASAPAPRPVAAPAALPALVAAPVAPSASVPASAPVAPLAPAPLAARLSESADLAVLKKGQALLYVDSPVATNVYIYGLLAGRTNEPITTKCGPRFIRLGTALGAWQGDGVVQIVKCGVSTHIAMAGK